MSGALHHSNGSFGVTVDEEDAVEGEGRTLDAENAIPEKAYRSQIIVVPSFRRDSMVDLLTKNSII
jgi:hypothetical protein